MFMQVDRSYERSQGGLGIGLTLVKRLVEMHGGTVAAHSEGPGRGSEFSIRLPLVAVEKRRMEAGIQPALQGPSRRILVVDDNVDAAESLALMLRLGGHAVRTASSQGIRASGRDQGLGLRLDGRALSVDGLAPT